MTVTQLPIQRSDQPDDRVPPHDLIAERSVLGALLLRCDMLLDVSEAGLVSGDFYRLQHGIIFDTIRRLAAHSEPIDAVTVAAALQRSGDLARIGGPVVIHDLVSATPSPWNAGHYAEIVRQHAVRRALIAAGTRVIQLGYAPDGDDLDGTVNAAITEVAHVGETWHGSTLVPLSEAVDATIGELADGIGVRVPTGIADLDAPLTGGLLPGTLTVVGARPSVGKTAVGLQMLLSAVLDAGLSGGMTTLEMSSPDILKRAVANRASLDYSRLLTSPREPLADAEWRAASRSLEEIRSAPLTIDDRQMVRTATIHDAIRRHKNANAGLCHLWVVDYAGLITPSQRIRERHDQVGEIFRCLKIMSRVLDVAIIALHQLNRAPATENRPPRMSDLRDSGEIEQHADNVVLLHRDMEKAPDLMGMHLCKNRRGPTRDVTLTWHGQWQRAEAQRWSPSGAAGGGR